MGTIRVTNLGKAYKQYPNRWSRLFEWMLPFAGLRHQQKWVMQDVNFSLEQGEAVGIIGMNGAGKSTLLKMITGTVVPTTGTVDISGRIAALLELGMGFHPDFTGRQNVFMAGQLIGISHDELTRLLPEIEAFAEIGDYIDQPVRTYSSGMQMRLAFSVATAVRPDVLIVDEALSVGDAYFQHKSFDRIRAFRAAGTTLLIVSHDKTAIQSICDRAVLLDAGRVAKQGAPEEVLDYYNAMLAGRENQKVSQQIREDGKIQTISGTGDASVLEIALQNAEGQPQEVFDVGAPATLKVVVRSHSPIPRLALGYMIKDRLGQPIFGTNTDLKKMPLFDVKEGETITYRFDFPINLGEGSFSIATSLSSTETHLVNNYEWRDLALVFTVVNLSKPSFVGCTWIDPQIHIDRPALLSAAAELH